MSRTLTSTSYQLSSTSTSLKHEDLLGVPLYRGPTTLGFHRYGVLPLWGPTALGFNGYGVILLWSPIVLGSDRLGVRPIMGPTVQRSYHFGVPPLRGPTLLGSYPFGEIGVLPLWCPQGLAFAPADVLAVAGVGEVGLLPRQLARQEHVDQHPELPHVLRRGEVLEGPVSCR